MMFSIRVAILTFSCIPFILLFILRRPFVEVILAELTSAITSGEGVEVRGFGGFYKRHRKGRIGINPKTGEKTEVAEKFVPFFKPGKFLKEAVNKG